MKAGLADGQSVVTFYSFSIGMSVEATDIQDKENIIRDNRDLSSSIDNIDLELSILNVYDCCSKDNWDGYGAKPITPARGQAFSQLSVLQISSLRHLMIM